MKTTALGALIFVLLFATPGLADSINLSATLTGGAEVPPNNSPAQGSAEFTYDTASNVLHFFVRYSGLTGPITTTDIHGPAAPGASGPVVYHFVSPESPITGNKTLNQSQATALLNGQLYIEIDTNAHQSGEIRGQIHK